MDDATEGRQGREDAREGGRARGESERRAEEGREGRKDIILRGEEGVTARGGRRRDMAWGKRRRGERERATRTGPASLRVDLCADADLVLPGVVAAAHLHELRAGAGGGGLEGGRARRLRGGGEHGGGDEREQERAGGGGRGAHVGLSRRPMYTSATSDARRRNTFWSRWMWEGAKGRAREGARGRGVSGAS